MSKQNHKKTKTPETPKTQVRVHYVDIRSYSSYNNPHSVKDVYNYDIINIMYVKELIDKNFIINSIIIFQFLIWFSNFIHNQQSKEDAKTMKSSSNSS